MVTILLLRLILHACHLALKLVRAPSKGIVMIVLFPEIVLAWGTASVGVSSLS
jgi:hypothetical protein